MTHHVPTPTQRHKQQLQHLRAAPRAVGLNGTRAAMRPLQQRPSRQAAVGSETEVSAGRPQQRCGGRQPAAHGIRAAVSTPDYSQQAPRRPSGLGSVEAMSSLSGALREQRGGVREAAHDQSQARRPAACAAAQLRRFRWSGRTWVRLETSRVMGGLGSDMIHAGPTWWVGQPHCCKGTATQGAQECVVPPPTAPTRTHRRT